MDGLEGVSTFHGDPEKSVPRGRWNVEQPVRAWKPPFHFTRRNQ